MIWRVGCRLRPFSEPVGSLRWPKHSHLGRALRTPPPLGSLLRRFWPWAQSRTTVSRGFSELKRDNSTFNPIGIILEPKPWPRIFRRDSTDSKKGICFGRVQWTDGFDRGSWQKLSQFRWRPGPDELQVGVLTLVRSVSEVGRLSTSSICEFRWLSES